MPEVGRNGYLPGDYNGGCVRSCGSLSLVRTTVSDCEIAAVGCAAGGAAARVSGGRADIGAFEVQADDRIFADGFDGP